MVMKAHIIESGVVINTILVDELAEGMIDGSIGGPGWLWDGETLAPPNQPPVDPKLVGVEILGVMCSATKQDQNGMTAIGLATVLARSGGGTLPDTVMQFENGNSLVITDANFNQVQAIWLPFRQSFFAAE